MQVFLFIQPEMFNFLRGEYLLLWYGLNFK